MWGHFWRHVEFFNQVLHCILNAIIHPLSHQVVNEIQWDERLDQCNHCTLFPYVVTAIGDTFPIATIGGSLEDVLYQPKYAEEVMKVLILTDHFGVYVWLGGPTIGSMAGTTVLQQTGIPACIVLVQHCCSRVRTKQR